MAPRTGPRGVTNEDVANRAGVTYVYAPETPAQQNQVNQQALLSYVLGGQAPGYGMKYGGFPTAAYGQAAVEGQAFGIADLARQAAQQGAIREQELVLQAERENRPATAAKYRYAQPSQQVKEAGAAVGGADTPIQQMLARARMQAVMDRESIARSEEVQPSVDARLRADLASQVGPYRQVSETLGMFTPSQLAQQIAVSRYGYDPMLASGLFGGATDVKYAEQVQTLRDAERQAQGFGLSNDEYLFETLGPEEFARYQEAKAMNAYENAMQPDYTQDDIDIYEAYGVIPSNNEEREIMLDPSFLQDVQEAKTRLSEADKALSADPVIADLVGNYYRNTGNSARAILLENILSQFSFLVRPIGANISRDVNIPGR